MKVYIYPADTEGCGYFRLIWPAQVLKSMGHDVRLIHPQANNKITGGLDAQGRLVTVSVPKDADVMVFQRLTSRMIIDGIDIIRSHGVAVVIDVDDDLGAISPTNPGFRTLHPKTGGKFADYNWHNAARACDKATLVTVSTPALLQRYATHGRGRVLYNCVPEVYTKIESQPEDGVIGWGGSTRSHTEDIPVVGPSMARLQRAGYKFKVVGPSRGTKSGFNLDYEPLCTEAVPIEQYPHEISKLQVGIAPLVNSRFNEAKSWLKLLEYAALGVPCIGSPRAEYRRIHALGIGLLADNPREWYRHARSLLNDANRRSEMSAAGRQIVKDKLTIEDNAWRWWEAWSDALKIQRETTGPKLPQVAVHS